MTPIIRLATGALLLAACSDQADESAPSATEAHASDAAIAGSGAEDVAMAQGRIVVVEGPARVRIDHDAIPAAGMDAMTMSFEATRGVALDGLEAGDEVHFRLDRGRDGTYRLGAICALGAADHDACMAAMTSDR